MKIRIISDIHRQINAEYPLTLDDNCDYTLLAGDVGPDYFENSKWISENVRMGAIVSGNHDAYVDREIPIEDIKEYYHRKFPLNSDITYFDVDVGVVSKMISDKILLVADVMYTDYKYRFMDDDNMMTDSEIIAINMQRAIPKTYGPYMNDFFYYTKEFNKFTNDSYRGKKLHDGIHLLNPQCYLNHFNRAFSEISRIVSENRDKDIILMTHHCLSPRCVSSLLYKDELMASYVSDKEDWIVSNANIKLIVSGHVHNRMEFKVGNALYVMNPLGYRYYNQDKMWNPDFFVDTDTWSVVNSIPR